MYSVRLLCFFSACLFLWLFAAPASSPFFHPLLSEFISSFQINIRIKIMTYPLLFFENKYYYQWRFLNQIDNFLWFLLVDSIWVVNLSWKFGNRLSKDALPFSTCRTDWYTLSFILYFATKLLSSYGLTFHHDMVKPEKLFKLNYILCVFSFLCFLSLVILLCCVVLCILIYFIIYLFSFISNVLIIKQYFFSFCSYLPWCTLYSFAFVLYCFCLCLSFCRAVFTYFFLQSNFSFWFHHLYYYYFFPICYSCRWTVCNKYRYLIPIHKKIREIFYSFRCNNSFSLHLPPSSIFYILYSIFIYFF